MRTRSSIVPLVLVLVTAMPRPASAWGFEPHKYIMTRAIALLPPEIRPFFQKYQTTIVEHVIDPDLWRTAGWEQEPPRHFLDMDAYGPYPFPNFPREREEAIKRYTLEFVEKNGQVPWRSVEIYQKLVEAFKQQAPYSRDNIKFFSSILTHYVSDAHVPFHAVVNYDGQLTGQWGIHSRFETELFERNRPILRVVPKPIGPVRNPRDFIFDALISGFPLAQTILDADKTAVKGRELYDDQYFTMFFSRVRPILERRLAEAITASASLIAAAWVEAGRPGVPLEQPRTPRKVRREGRALRLVVPSLVVVGLAESSRDHGFEPVQHQERDYRHGGRNKRQVVGPTADGHSHCRVDPDRGGGRQPVNAAVRAHDRAGAKKADAGHDLCRDASRVATGTGQLE
jgi:hypothetical protein